MTSIRNPLARGILAVAMALAIAAPAGADVVVKQKSVSQGLGGFGDATTTTTLSVSGKKSRSDDEYTYTGRFKTFVGKKPKKSATITRVDKEAIWIVDEEKKQYEEMTFAEMREAFAKAMDEAGKSGTETQAKDAEMTFTLDVKKGGASNVNGFDCRNVTITCVGKAKDPKAGESAEIRLVMDQWIAKDAPGTEEISSFYKAFAKALGLDPQFSRMPGMARATYGNAMKEIAKKLEDVEGYPIRSIFTIEGMEATAEQKKQIADAKEKAAEDQEKAAKNAEKQEKVQDASDAASVGAAAAQGQDVKGGIGGFLARKLASKAAKSAQEKAKSNDSGGDGPLFKIVTEVESISKGAAPAETFEVTGLKKVERKAAK